MDNRTPKVTLAPGAEADKLDKPSGELSDSALPAIVGGLNPQPLPPLLLPPTRVLPPVRRI